MAYQTKRRLLPVLPTAAALVLSACVSQGTYDQLQAQYQQVQQQNSQLTAQVAADKAQICRLQGAIKYTVNADQLFASGSYQMSDRGKQIIANMASQLAPTQQNKIVVSGYTDNAPIGPALAREGITSNQILSQKRAETRSGFTPCETKNSMTFSARFCDRIWFEVMPSRASAGPIGALSV